MGHDARVFGGKRAARTRKLMEEARMRPLVEEAKKELAMNFELSAAMIIGKYAIEAGVPTKVFEKAIYGE
jgi:hypothetical protein